MSFKKCLKEIDKAKITACRNNADTLADTMQSVNQDLRGLYANAVTDEAITVIAEAIRAMTYGIETVQGIADTFKGTPDMEGYLIYRFTECPRVSFGVPSLLYLCGEIMNVTTWKSMLIQTCEYLREKDPELFEAMVDDKGDQKTAYIRATREPSKYKGAHKLEGCEIYVDANLGSDNTCKAVRNLLALYEFDLNECAVYYKPDENKSSK